MLDTASFVAVVPTRGTGLIRGTRCPRFRLAGGALLLLLMTSACGPALTVQVQDAPPASAPAAQEPGEVRDGAEAEIPGARETETLLVTLVTYLTFFAELCGALIIGVAVIRGLLRFIPHIFRREPPGETYSEDIRLQLGKSLALALEFELGADILKTAVAPTLAIIAQLAAIAALRTFLNYFLERELQQAERRRERQQPENSPPDNSAAARVYPTDSGRPPAPR